MEKNHRTTKAHYSKHTASPIPLHCNSIMIFRQKQLAFSCPLSLLPCDPNATLTILGTVAVLAASSIEQNASVIVFSQQWRKLTNLTSLVISSIVLYLYLNCK